MMKIFFVVFSVVLLIYIIWPAPSSINDFLPLPNSAKSNLEGDTIQIPNVSAYFSDNFREFIVPFYSANYQAKSGFFFPPFKINHPPEYSWIAIKKHTDSTYIEELIYPLRGSLYVNGFEQIYPDGSPKWWGAIKFDVDGKEYATKTTLRFYPSTWIARLLVWLGIVISILLTARLGKKIIGVKL